MPKTSLGAPSGASFAAGLGKDAVVGACDSFWGTNFGGELGATVFCVVDDLDAVAWVFAGAAVFLGAVTLASAGLAAAADLVVCVTVLTFSALGDGLDAAIFFDTGFLAAALRAAPDFAAGFGADLTGLLCFEAGDDVAGALARVAVVDASAGLALTSAPVSASTFTTDAESGVFATGIWSAFSEDGTELIGFTSSAE
tara:strand:- start:53560 stop:54153 length:594 start_codon:yes stop_codon:yes gene_type:complete